MTLTFPDKLELPAAPAADVPLTEALPRFAEVVRAYTAAVEASRPIPSGTPLALAHALAFGSPLGPVEFLSQQWTQELGTRGQLDTPQADWFELDANGLYADRRTWHWPVVEPLLFDAYRLDVDWFEYGQGYDGMEIGDGGRGWTRGFGDPIKAWRWAGFNARRGVASSQRNARRWAATRDQLLVAANAHYARLLPHIAARLDLVALTIAEANPAPTSPVSTPRRGNRWD